MIAHACKVWEPATSYMYINLNHLTPQLPPSEFKVLAACKILLDRIMYTLNNQVLKSHPLQQVCHRGWLSKWIYGPTIPTISNHKCLADYNKWKMSQEVNFRCQLIFKIQVHQRNDFLSFTEIILNIKQVYSSTNEEMSYTWTKPLQAEMWQTEFHLALTNMLIPVMNKKLLRWESIPWFPIFFDTA